MRSRAVVAAALATLAAALPATAQARSRVETAHAGRTSARLSYSLQRGANQYLDRRVHLSISFAGRVRYSADLRRAFGYVRVPVGAFNRAARSLMIADLDGDGRNEVVVDFFSGGAHCCSWSRIFFFRGGRYRSVAHDWIDPGYSLRTIAGAREFVTADGRLAYEFSSFAAAGFPLRILHFTAGRFRDITGVFPARLRRDAAQWLRLTRREERRRGGEVGGVLAAYVADELRLGHRPRALAELRRARRTRTKVPASYRRRLLRRLKTLGYPPG